MSRFLKLKDETFSHPSGHISEKSAEKTVPTESSWDRVKSLFKWFNLLSKINDDEAKVICGTDGALYLVFNRYASKFFAVISVLNLLVFVPIYLSGNNQGAEMFNKTFQLVLLRLISVLNIKNDKYKVNIIYGLLFILYTFFTFVFMYTYWKKSYQWRHKEHSHTAKF